MNAKFWIAALSYLLLTFAIAGGWHLALFKDTYARLGIFTRPRPIIPLGVLSMVLQAAVVSYLYPLFYRGGSPLMTGATFGLLLGVFMGSNAFWQRLARTKSRLSAPGSPSRACITCSSLRWSGSSSASFTGRSRAVPSNKRLKLAGA